MVPPPRKKKEPKKKEKKGESQISFVIFYVWEMAKIKLKIDGGQNSFWEV